MEGPNSEPNSPNDVKTKGTTTNYPHLTTTKGHAECGVREMKHLLGKTKSYEKFRFTLREWRNTPRYDGLSPAQWLYGRRQRTEAVAIPQVYE